MKAALIEKFGTLTVKDMPEPRMGDYDALCELLYGATCTGTDSHVLDGSFPWISPLPTVLGHESVGRVVAVGPRVRNFRVGDLVTRVGTPASPDGRISVTWGGFAEMGIAKDHWAMCADGLPQSEWLVHRPNQIVPAAVDPRVAPMFTTWRETLSFMRRLGTTDGSSVLIFGSGGVALAMAVHAVNLGAAFVGMVGARAMEDRVRNRTKVKLYVDYRSEGLEAAINQARPEGFDLVIDSVGRQGVGDLALAFVKPGGKYSIYGMKDVGKISINFNRARGPVTMHPCAYIEAEAHQEVSEWVLQGKLDASLWYDPARPWPLAEIADAYAACLSRKTPKALVQLKK